MSYKLNIPAFVAAALLAASGTAAFADVPESPDPIKVIMNDWTGQHVSTKIAGALLEKMGYNIEYVSAGALPQHPGLAQGNLHFQAEVWSNNVGDLYPKMVESGEIVVLGDLGLEPKEGWIYPPYMEERCPGLPDYQALYDCAQAFATAETFPNGRLITYPADWGTRSRDVVDGIDLPFKTIAGGSEGAMIAELTSAMATEAPIISMMWQPHWIFAAHDFNWVEWTPIEGDCVEETQEKDNACGFAQATVNKVAWSGFEDKWPAAFKMLSMMTLSNDDQNAGILEVDNNGRDIHEVAAEWLANNEGRWQPWIEAAMQ
ncbi:MAG: ABC transporter substrate-binding protein [Rhodobacteraceae bacterium]|jgi:glycine betaine/proline transport system substrate-binding protein|nr:ABC transporter substrate-binding protein [Paracoccaceae bacterium]MBT6299643.1 ABC transporter substrate-binding protein [Paracoccaceae bacterium]MBT6544481.1 ABC transporter substrate-binding protein [Paracoccaceae bacterium]MDE2633109.1 ABC transporter substrate-binding protein [Paracoccaceae bacterium]HBR60973.1 glycine/betaine ABC transporter substrate-binding protein [Paracoccaceae bacterium]